MATASTHARVAVVAGEQEDQRRDQADADGDEPGDAERGTSGYPRARPMTPCAHPRRRRSRSTTCASSRPTSARGVVLDADGEPLAGPGRAGDAARELLDAAPATPTEVARHDARTARSSPRATTATRSSSPAALRAARAGPLRPAGRAGRPRRRPEAAADAAQAEPPRPRGAVGAMAASLARRKTPARRAWCSRRAGGHARTLSPTTLPRRACWRPPSG